MVLLAQIADLFSQNSWNILLGVCLASPLLGALGNVFVKQNSSVGSAAFVLTAYYSFLGGLSLIISWFGEPLPACLVFFLLLAFGPLWGLMLLFEKRRTNVNSICSKYD